MTIPEAVDRAVVPTTADLSEADPRSGAPAAAIVKVTRRPLPRLTLRAG
jgi:hypothetical protein